MAVGRHILMVGLAAVGASLNGATPTSAAQQHVDRANALAGSSYMQTTARLQCSSDNNAALSLVRSSATPGPARLFDNLYFVGLGGVGAYAINTGDGIILIDSLNSTADAETVIEPGMRQMGLDPANVKYVVVTHGHGDHFGGAQHFADRYHSRVLMSEADWQLALNRKPPPGAATNPFGPPPAKDLVATDGQQLVLGKQRITIVFTPGHTPGTISLIVPVTDHGRRHVLAMWGGTGIPRDAEARRQYIASASKFDAVAQRAGADVELSNHPFVDDFLSRLKTMRERPNGPNPFVIGRSAYHRYAQIIRECALAADARASAGSQ